MARTFVFTVSFSLARFHKDEQSCCCAVACKSRQPASFLICKPDIMHQSAYLLKLGWERSLWHVQVGKGVTGSLIMFYFLGFFLRISLWMHENLCIESMCINGIFCSHSSNAFKLCLSVNQEILTSASHINCSGASLSQLQCMWKKNMTLSIVHWWFSRRLKVYFH